SEFLTMIRSKGFIIGILLLPILMGTSIAVQTFSRKHVDVTARNFAVVDATGELYPVIAANAEARNAYVEAHPETPMPKFIPIRGPSESRPSDELRLELSDKIRNGELYAFVEIPQSVLNTESVVGGQAKIAYYSDKPTDEDLRYWVTIKLNEELRRRRI